MAAYTVHWHRFLGMGLGMALLLLLVGCGSEDQSTRVVQRAVAIEHGDECHLCGMIIENFPGPKGELYEPGESAARKFCSTRDLFAYLLDPERRHRIEQVYVHDMAVTPWDHPGNEAFVDARQAWYVVGSERQGGMGPTLASFASREHAERFTQLYGGQLYRFEQIDLALLSRMGI